jgi:hypothetical protein
MASIRVKVLLSICACAAWAMPAHAGQFVEHAGHAAHIVHLLQLIAQVLEIELLALFDLAREFFRLRAVDFLLASSISDSTSPMPRIRDARRSGWKGSRASVFSPTPRNLMACR